MFIPWHPPVGLYWLTQDFCLVLSTRERSGSRGWLLRLRFVLVFLPYRYSMVVPENGSRLFIFHHSFIVLFYKLRPLPIWDVTQKVSAFMPTFRDSVASTFLDCLTVKDETDRLPRNVDNNYKHTLRNIPEERRPPLHCGECLKSRILRDDFLIPHSPETGLIFSAYHRLFIRG